MAPRLLCPTRGGVSNRDLLVVFLFLCQTIVCDSQCPKFAEKPLETRVQDASIVFRAVVIQAHFQVSGLRITESRYYTKATVKAFVICATKLERLK